MVYLTLFKKSDTKFTLSAVTEPKKNARGFYNVEKTSSPFKELSNFITPVKDTVGEASSSTSEGTSFQVAPTTRFKVYSRSSNEATNSYPIITRYDYSVVHPKSIGTPIFGYNDMNDIKNLVSKIDLDKQVRFLYIKSNGEIGYKEHNKGEWSVTVTNMYVARRGKNGKAIAYETWTQKCNQSTKSLMGPEDYYSWSVFEGKIGKNYNYNTGKVVKTSSVGVGGVNWYRYDTVYTVELKTSYYKLASANNWELGSVSMSDNTGENYCFYSDTTKYLKYVSYLNPNGGAVWVLPAHLKKGSDPKVHDCATHGGTQSETGVYYGTGTSTGVNNKLTYDPYTKAFTRTGESTARAVNKLEFGTRGAYIDGVATVPYLILTLAGDENFNNKIEMTIHEKDKNTFVSLVHERNLGDSYNTFQLQLFDKDAKQVEAKLLLGFRYLEFYYTDNVSTSKRFRGEVLDYKTVITGKGLMLTLTGYTSNVIVYTGKDSIPWSKIIEARSFSFYYWLNNAGEYHGEVRLTSADKYVGYGDSPKSPQENVDVLNSTEGLILSPEYAEEVIGDISDNVSSEKAMYSLKATFQVGSSKKDTETMWTSFKRMYYKSLDGSRYEEFIPRVKVWSLDQYVKDRNTTFGNELPEGLTEGDLTEPRPSNIVILICIINGWAFNFKDIVKTRKVSSIPDMVSMSFTEYIKEELIPLSIAEGSGGSAQFYFWFDDKGFAHYGPRDETSTCSLYFNSKEVADSYPLISFVAASNGSVLMQVDATKTMPSINILTGDEIEVSALPLEDGDEYLANYHKSEEWYSTNYFTKSKSSNLISYSNTTVSTSDEDLLKALRYRYGYISQYSFKASLDVYGCSDLTPGQMVDIYIYTGDGKRSSDPISQANKSSSQKGVDEYIGNTSIHHSSGTYFINKITDNISGGRYISSLEVFKINEGQLKLMIGDVESLETYEVKKHQWEIDYEESVGKDGTSTAAGEITNPIESYSQYKDLYK